MIYTNTKPQTVYGISRNAVTPRPFSTPIPTTEARAFSLNPETGLYEQCDDRNTAVDVSAVIQCAGRLTGLYHRTQEGIMNKNLAVSSPLKSITPAPGDWPLILAMINAFTNSDSEAEAAEQKAHFMAWLKHAAQAVQNSQASPAPALILRPRDKNPNAADFMVKHIIASLLGDVIEDFTPYLLPQGRPGWQKLTAQSTPAALLYADKPTFSPQDYAANIHIKDLLNRLATIDTYIESVFPKIYNCNSEQRLKPIFRPVIFTMAGTPFFETGREAPAVMLNINKPTLLSKESALKDLARRTRAELPAFLHFLIHEEQDTTPAPYISPSFYRAHQKAAFLTKYKSEYNPEHTFYRLGTLLLLTQPAAGQACQHASTLDLFRCAITAAKDLSMPLPAANWTPDKLHSVLKHCAKHYPAYLATNNGGGWTIHLQAMEKDILAP